MIKILIVEDEISMRQGLKDNLEFEGYSVEEAGDGKQALEMMAGNEYDLVLLDVMLPEVQGFDVCRQVRASGNRVPIIMLTAKGEEIDKVLGLELGADDYITKPFSLRELLARIKAILRRQPHTAGPSTSHFHIGRMAVDFSNYTALVDGSEVNMTHREFEVLKFLIDHKNEAVSREELMNEIWGYNGTTTRTIDNFILRLRQKIESDAAHPRLILTVHGIGYKLIGLQ
jgi:DNA-binding response OmpR family regulator